MDRPVGRPVRGLVLLQLRDGGLHLDQAHGAGGDRVHGPGARYSDGQEESTGGWWVRRLLIIHDTGHVTVTSIIHDTGWSCNLD